MNRFLWTAIAGLVLGAVAFGMLQRGCDASGAREAKNGDDAPAVASPSPRFDAGPRGIRQVGPDGQRIRPTIRSDRAGGGRNYPSRPSAPAGARAGRDSASIEEARADANNRATVRGGSDPGERAQETRRQTLERLNRVREARRQRASSRGGLSREAAQILRRQAGVDDRHDPERIEQAYEKARRAFDSQIVDSEEVTERVARERREGPDSTGNSGGEGDDPGAADPEAATEDALEQALAGADPNSPLRDSLQGALAAFQSARAGGGRGGSVSFSTVGGRGGFAGGGGTPAPGDGSGGDGGGDDASDGGGADPGDVVGDPGDGASDPIVMPPPTDGEDSGGQTPPPEPMPAEARWAPVDAAPRDGFGFRAADLFLSFENPTSVTVLTSAPGVGIQVVGGRFFQEPSFGSNTPPDPGLVDAAPFAAVDSFLTVGGMDPLFPSADSTPDPSAWGETLQAVWAGIGARTTTDASTFGEGRHVIWIARIAAGGPNVTVTGAVGVNFVDLVTGEQGFTIVPIPPCASCFEGADGETPPVLLSSVSVSSPSIGGGGELEGLVTLSAPATAGGTVVSLASDDEGVTLPSSVVVPGGLRTASFVIRTQRVTEARTATITASLDDRQTTTALRIEPLRPVSVVFSPSIVQSGGSATATVTLNAPAPPGGAAGSILLGADAEQAVEAPTTISFAAGARTGDFQVRALPVSGQREVRFLVGIGVNGVFGSLVVEGRRADLDPDGVVGPADLSRLLANWGACPDAGSCAADLNGDGRVGPDDLSILLSEWGQGAPDDEPVDEGVIARWIAIDNASCSDVEGMRTADLYVGFDTPAQVNVVSSGDAAGIEISDGAFYQHPAPASNKAPTPGIEQIFPCIPFDSHLAIEGVASPQISFTPGGEPNPQDWGSTLRAEWFVTSASPGRQDATLFGDNRFYTRLGRFTAPAEASVGGEIEVFFSDGSAGNVDSAIVRVLDWSRARGELDLNADGLVDSADVALLVESVQSGQGAGRQVSGGASPDVNGDGAVDGADLRTMLEALGS